MNILIIDDWNIKDVSTQGDRLKLARRTAGGTEGEREPFFEHRMMKSLRSASL
ncbi:MAG: hypothetical protein JRJ69_16905 [Deltaproteobacteria bacterium]|nr:hypothetical protein [Deltaproteobacteria bacterium]